MSRPVVDPARRNGGFTLVEVVVTTALVALVAVALGAAFTVIVRTAPTTENRVDDANALLGLTNWIPQDVASTEETGFERAPYTNACSGVTGSDVLQLEWSEGGDAFVVDYRFVDLGPGVGVVSRFACVNGQPATSLDLTPPLARIAGAPPVDATLIVGGAGHVGVEFIVRVLDDDGITERDILSLDAFTTNVRTTLPPTTLPGGTSTTTLAVTTTTGSAPNQPPVAHDIWVNIDVDPPAGAIVYLPVFDPDGPSPNFVSYAPDLVTDPVFLTPFSPYPPFDPIDGNAVFVDSLSTAVPGSSQTYVYTVVDEDGATASANITVLINSSPSSTSTTVGTGTTTTTIPCVADIVSVVPSSVGIRPNGKLDDDVVVTLASGGSCLPLVLSFDPDTTDADTTPEELAFNGFASVTIDKNAFTWNQPGSPPWSFGLELRQGSNGSVEDTATLAVTP